MNSMVGIETDFFPQDGNSAKPETPAVKSRMEFYRWQNSEAIGAADSQATGNRQ